MEEALSRSEERFRLAARATKDVFWDLDIRSGMTWRSETFWEHFGYLPKDTEPDVTGWKNLLHPEDRDRVWNSFQTALHGTPSLTKTSIAFDGRTAPTP